MSSHAFVMDNTTRGLLALSQSLLDLNDTDIAPTPPTPNLSDYVLPSFLNDHDTAQCDSPDPQDQSASSFLNLDDRTPVRLVTPSTLDSSTASTLDNSPTFQVPKVLKFIRGRNGGTQSTYGGFVYTFDRKKVGFTTGSVNSKDRKQYTPFCTPFSNNASAAKGETMPSNMQPKPLIPASAASGTSYLSSGNSMRKWSRNS